MKNCYKKLTFFSVYVYQINKSSSLRNIEWKKIHYTLRIN